MMRRRVISQGPRLAPGMPAMTTKTAVQAGLPCTILATSTAIGTFVDLIAIDATSRGAKPKSRAQSSAAAIVPSEPARSPHRAGPRWLKNACIASRCSAEHQHLDGALDVEPSH